MEESNNLLKSKLNSTSWGTLFFIFTVGVDADDMRWTKFIVLFSILSSS